MSRQRGPHDIPADGARHGVAVGINPSVKTFQESFAQSAESRFGVRLPAFRSTPPGCAPAVPAADFAENFSANFAEKSAACRASKRLRFSSLGLTPFWAGAAPLHLYRHFLQLHCRARLHHGRTRDQRWEADCRLSPGSLKKDSEKAQERIANLGTEAVWKERHCGAGPAKHDEG